MVRLSHMDMKIRQKRVHWNEGAQNEDAQV